ncbi:het domain-containing protein [Fusarium globosum]|uniref:Het domain-containing protein n=1 Tax=Fusarium globosum TaxID=78864 RepID=A0A8H5XP45_9HYPO|nr:het domain-containing protein [Fusarium globosum]
MAGMFQIALYAQEPLRLDLYGFHDMEYEDEDFALRFLVKERSVGEILDLYDETRRRINTWANGLLECNQGNNVDFLHRTHASKVAADWSDELSEVLDELECAFDEMFRTKQAHFRMEVGEPKLVLREEVLRSNAASYVAKKLVHIPDYLLKSVLAPLSITVAAEIPPADTIYVLLQHGEDTNKVL